MQIKGKTERHEWIYWEDQSPRTHPSDIGVISLGALGRILGLVDKERITLVPPQVWTSDNTVEIVSLSSSPRQIEIRWIVETINITGHAGSGGGYRATTATVDLTREMLQQLRVCVRPAKAKDRSIYVYHRDIFFDVVVPKELFWKFCRTFGETFPINDFSFGRKQIRAVDGYYERPNDWHIQVTVPEQEEARFLDFLDQFAYSAVPNTE